MDSQNSAGVLRVAVFGTSQLLQRRVERIVREDSNMDWAGSVDSVDAAIRMCEWGDPDVLLIDSAADPGWKLCLMLTGMFEDLTVVEMLDESVRNPVDSAWALLHGARGIIGVDAGIDRLGAAVHGAVAVGRYVDPGLEVAVTPSSQGNRLGGKPLTRREFEVLQLIAEGRTAEQIGYRLGITTETVRTHVSHILKKLGARDRAHAVAVAYQMSLLPCEPAKDVDSTEASAGLRSVRAFERSSRP